MIKVAFDVVGGSEEQPMLHVYINDLPVDGWVGYNDGELGWSYPFLDDEQRPEDFADINELLVAVTEWVQKQSWTVEWLS